MACKCKAMLRSPAKVTIPLHISDKMAENLNIV